MRLGELRSNPHLVGKGRSVSFVAGRVACVAHSRGGHWCPTRRTPLRPTRPIMAGHASPEHRQDAVMPGGRRQDHVTSDWVGYCSALRPSWPQCGAIVHWHPWQPNYTNCTTILLTHIYNGPSLRSRFVRSRFQLWSSPGWSGRSLEALSCAVLSAILIGPCGPGPFAVGPGRCPSRGWA